MKVLLVDNFDSFTHNIRQYLYEVTGVDPVVVPNTTAHADLPLHEVQAVVLSPGPGRPGVAADFGVCAQIVATTDLPLLGVCLGHQGIAEHHGARTVRAPAPAHGVVDAVTHTGTGLFEGLPQPLAVVRYHSLVSVDVPEPLEVTARTADGLVMAVAHRHRPVWGVQFHPESIAAQGGHEILRNFVRLAREHHRTRGRAPGAAATAAAGSAPGAAAQAFRRVGGAPRAELRMRHLARPLPPLETFRSRYADRPHAFWLDSEHSDRPGSRFSLMGAGGTAGAVVFTYDLPARRLTLTGAEHVEHVEGDLFTLLGQILDDVHVDTPVHWPMPFTGGLVGYLGYELKALTTGAESHRAPGPDAWLLHATDFVLHDHLLQQTYECTLVPHGQDAPAPAGPCADVARPGAAPAPSDVVPGPFVPGAVDEHALDLRDGHDAYVGKIDRAQRLIDEGETYEVCLTTLARVPAPADGLAAYAAMRRVSPVPYGAYLRCGETQVLSSSPETFLRIGADRTVESRPIKGTRPRGTSDVEDELLRRDLMTSAKDRAENLMIVDLVRHDLNTVCEPGSVHVPEAFAVESYSSVHQLVSSVRGRLRWDLAPLDAVRACFPGGSMTGAPKRRTMEIIDALEDAPRGVYSGSIGWFSYSGALDLSIVIRTAVLHGGTATVGVGGAVTALSDPEAEFEEVLVKASVPYFGLRTACERVR